MDTKNKIVVLWGIIAFLLAVAIASFIPGGLLPQLTMGATFFVTSGLLGGKLITSEIKTREE